MWGENLGHVLPSRALLSWSELYFFCWGRGGGKLLNTQKEALMSY
jgi:hypothetical protein